MSLCNFCADVEMATWEGSLADFVTILRIIVTGG